MKKQLLYLLIMSFVCFPLFPLPVLAADLETDAGFTVVAVLPDNQKNPEAGYFDLLVEPGQEQNLVIEIDNPNETDIVVTIEAITASTNRNGIILYSTPGIYDPSMAVSFSDLAEISEPELTIPALSTVEAGIPLRIPQEEWDGMLLGSIRVVRQLDESDSAPNSQNGIVNQFSYIIGVRLTQREQEINPDFDIGNIQAELVNYKAAITTFIHNVKPLIVSGASVHTQIYPKDSDIPVIEKRQERVDMAPNSVFPMTLIDQEGYGFEAGAYHAVVELSYNGQDWSWEQDFTIQPQQAENLNQSAVNQFQNRPDSAPLTPWVSIFLAMGGTVLLLLIVLAGIKLLKAK